MRHDLFGFANYTGVAAVLILMVLLATSNDYSLRKLGTPGWKQLQRWNYAIFVLVAAHTVAYQTLEKQHLPFVAVAIASLGTAVALQAFGFFMRRRWTANRLASNGIATKPPNVP